MPDPEPTEQPDVAAGPAAARGSDLRHLLRGDLAALRDAHLLRTRRVVRHIDATHVELADGRRLVNFAGNDYLAITHHPDVLAATTESIRLDGFGTGGSALISGYTHRHAEAERRIAAWKGTEAAVLVGSGYQANVAAVQTIASLAPRGSVTTKTGLIETTPGRIRFLIDKLSHASIIDAVRASGVPFRTFPHNHLVRLEHLLSAADPRELQVVITESVFSMDGDTADLAGLAALKRRQPFVLLLDEAHGSGVYGPGGAGLAVEMGLRDAVDISVVTLSKALGCYGGAVCASGAFCEMLVNRGRAYVFATSLPACVAAGVTAALDVLEREPDRARRLRASARRVRTAIGANTASTPVDSPIIPVILRDADRALRAAEQFQANGLWVLAVRPPTVPRGSSRLRVTISSAHTDDELDRLIEAIRSLPRSDV